VADLTVDTNGRAPAEVVQDLVDQLEQLPRHA
jgi:hypothetical protein